MIATIILVGLGFAWLLRETNYMTIRLMVGDLPLPEYEYITLDGVYSNIWSLPVKHQPFWAKHPNAMQPLCGMEWLKTREHIVPINKVELYFGNGYRQTFTLKKPELIKEIVRINTGKKYFKKLATA